MTKADWNYRPDDSRSVNIFGEFSDNLLANVLPKIATLRAQNSKPVTAYIHSRGGIVRCLDVIHGAITSKDADGNSCRMITVAAGDASSAAANLFAFGGYAIAYPHSRFHFHGIRLSEVEVTMEDASSLAAYLATRNREVALSLAQCMISRLIHRYLLLADEIAAEKTDFTPSMLLLMQRFVACVNPRISPTAENLLNQTIGRVRRVISLFAKIIRSVKFEPGAPGIKHDTSVFRSVLNHELRENKNTDWRLDENGLAKVTSDYFLLRDFAIGEHQELVQTIIETYGYHFLTSEDSQQIRKIAAKDPTDAQRLMREKVFPSVKLFWYFTVVLCRLLQQGENRLDANDVYWLGVADEVLGTDLTGERIIMEADIDATPSSASDTSSAPA